MTQQTTRMDDATLDDAVDRITNHDGVREGSRSDVWVTFKCDPDKVQGAVQAVLHVRGVVIHKVERQDGFLSVVLEDYADEL